MAKTSQLMVGTGKVRITPPVGIPFTGHGYRISEGIHDDLWARVMVLESGGRKVAIVSLDLFWPMPGGDYVKIRSAVEAAAGIDAANVMVSATHSHQGPAFWASANMPSPMKRQRQIIDPWVAALPAMVGEAAAAAAANAGPARLTFSTTPMTGISYNRRKSVPEGVFPLIGNTPEMPAAVRAQYVRWGMTPDEAEAHAPLGVPDGPIDPDMGVITVEDADGKPLGVLVNFGCHAVACSPPAPLLISAGFPGYCSGLVEQATGAICLYTQGCCGDVRPYRSSAKGGFAEAQRIGMTLASGVIKAIKDAEPVEKTGLKIESAKVKVETRKFPPLSQIRQIREDKNRQLSAAVEAGKFRDARALTQEIAPLDCAVGYDDLIPGCESLSLEIQAIMLGDVALLSIPNEVNVSIGFDIKKSAPTKKLLLLTVTNGYYYHLLKRDEYAAGGHEVGPCCIAPGAGEKVTAEALKLLERLK